LLQRRRLKNLKFFQAISGSGWIFFLKIGGSGLHL
jgi:hypothetical protein